VGYEEAVNVLSKRVYQCAKLLKNCAIQSPKNVTLKLLYVYAFDACVVKSKQNSKQENSVHKKWLVCYGTLWLNIS
jgi:hypothetical protein